MARSSSTTSGENRPCTEQWPFQRIIRAARSCSAVSPPFGRCGSQTTQSSREQAQLQHRGVAAEVLVGQEQHLARPGFCSKAHSSATSALLEVHTAPPWRPQNALMSAEEFM